MQYTLRKTKKQLQRLSAYLPSSARASKHWQKSRHSGGTFYILSYYHIIQKSLQPLAASLAVLTPPHTPYLHDIAASAAFLQR